MGHLVGGPVDDRYFSRKLVRDPQFLPVGREHEATRARADDDVVRQRLGLGVDDMHHVGYFRCHIDSLAIVADHHALWFGAGGDFTHDHLFSHVDDLQAGVLFVGDVDEAVIRAEVKDLRAWSGRDMVDHLQSRHVDDVDHIIVAAGHIKQRVVVVEAHVARAARGLDPFDDAVVLWIENSDVVRLLVAHEDKTRPCGKRGYSQAKRGQQQRYAAISANFGDQDFLPTTTVAQLADYEFSEHSSFFEAIRIELE